MPEAPATTDDEVRACRTIPEAATSTALERASTGLLYMSESDHPFDFVSYPTAPAGRLTAAQFLHTLGRLEGTVIEDRSLDQVFAPLVNPDVMGPDAARFAALKRTIQQRQTYVQVFAVGTVQVQFYFVGHDRCGVLAYGFGRARCGACGHDMLVAFSCKLRGVCPSCCGRRMSETAASVADRVFPAVALRQWVLSVPFELRAVLAADPAMLTLTSRVFFEEIRRWYRAASGIERNDALRVECGAITFVHRGGGSLNLHVHLHVLVADGVWRCATDGTTPTFVAARPPTRADLEGVIVRVAKRVAAGIERAGERVGATDAALDGCRRAAVSRGTYGVLDAQGELGTGEASDEGRFGRRPPKAQVAVIDGFNLHASVIVGAQDFDSRERLVRYVARPTVALDRVSELPDGRVAWKLKIPGGRGETHRIVEPMEFMARLSALVPPPRYPLTRYHGVFAPNSPWRAVIVPAPPPERTCAFGETASAPKPTVDGADVCAVDAPKEAAAPVRAKGADRIDWATLMHRVWGWDVLKCPRCEGRMRFIAVIQARDVIERILTHVGLSAAPVVFAPARRWDDTS